MSESVAFFLFFVLTLGYYYCLSCAQVQDTNIYIKSFVAMCSQLLEDLDLLFAIT